MRRVADGYLQALVLLEQAAGTFCGAREIDIAENPCADPYFYTVVAFFFNP
jgi:hypothetical protein